MKPYILPAVVAALMTVAGCSGGKREDATTAAKQQVVKGVAVEQIQSAELVEHQEAVGTVKAIDSAIVSARIAGTITSMNVKEGDRVAKGATLATIEASETAAGAASAKAGVDEAKQGVEEAVARKKLADATFQRYQKLFAEQAVTRQEFESRQMEQEVASRGVLRAEARLAQAGEIARSATITADYTRVTAPLSGIVVARNLDRGATVFPGMPILTIDADSGFRLEVQVPESLKGKVAAGGEVELALDSLPRQKGRVVEVVPLIDPASRTFTAKIAVKAQGLRSGAFGRALFPVGMVKGIMVPKASLQDKGVLQSVWVVDAAGIARMRLVKTGRTVGDKVEILSGLTAGEKIVAAGVEKITDGAKVE